jgi:hypothetical protein
MAEGGGKTNLTETKEGGEGRPQKRQHHSHTNEGDNQLSDSQCKTTKRTRERCSQEIVNGHEERPQSVFWHRQKNSCMIQGQEPDFDGSTEKRRARQYTKGKKQQQGIKGRYGNSILGVYRRNLCEVMVSKA